MKEGGVDILFITESCRPYSISRNARLAEGPRTHKEYFHQKVSEQVVKIVEPKAWIFEQVSGFSLPESKIEPKSPLTAMMEFIEEYVFSYS